MFWLLLLHQVPPQPPYFRAKVLRRLNQVGALAIKNSSYVLPANDDTTEDLEWIRREIVEEGGEAWLFRTEILSGLSDEAIREAFRALRTPEYAELGDSAQLLLEEIGNEPNSKPAFEGEWRKLKRRFEEIRRSDFLNAPKGEETENIMNKIDDILHAKPAAKAGRPTTKEVKGCTWVTRRGVKIDRIASAWLVRRFIDPAAKFAFVDPTSYEHKNSEIRFDMYEGEFTHEQDMCTFEVLLQWSGLTDPGLKALAEVVHDIDIKDGKYQRVETPGISPIIDGIVLRHKDDLTRIEDGSMLLESLYERFRSPSV